MRGLAVKGKDPSLEVLPWGSRGGTEEIVCGQGSHTGAILPEDR
jgi:hypothetical protein